MTRPLDRPPNLSHFMRWCCSFAGTTFLFLSCLPFFSLSCKYPAQFCHAFLLSSFFILLLLSGGDAQESCRLTELSIGEREVSKRFVAEVEIENLDTSRVLKIRRLLSSDKVRVVILDPRPLAPQEKAKFVLQLDPLEEGPVEKHLLLSFEDDPLRIKLTGLVIPSIYKLSPIVHTHTIRGQEYEFPIRIFNPFDDDLSITNTSCSVSKIRKSITRNTVLSQRQTVKMFSLFVSFNGNPISGEFSILLSNSETITILIDIREGEPGWKLIPPVLNFGTISEKKSVPVVFSKVLFSSPSSFLSAINIKAVLCAVEFSPFYAGPSLSTRLEERGANKPLTTQNWLFSQILIDIKTDHLEHSDSPSQLFSLSMNHTRQQGWYTGKVCVFGDLVPLHNSISSDGSHIEEEAIASHLSSPASSITSKEQQMLFSIEFDAKIVFGSLKYNLMDTVYFFRKTTDQPTSKHLRLTSTFRVPVRIDSVTTDASAFIPHQLSSVSNILYPNQQWTGISVSFLPKIYNLTSTQSMSLVHFVTNVSDFYVPLYLHSSTLQDENPIIEDNKKLNFGIFSLGESFSSSVTLYNSHPYQSLQFYGIFLAETFDGGNSYEFSKNFSTSGIRIADSEENRRSLSPTIRSDSDQCRALQVRVDPSSSSPSLQPQQPTLFELEPQASRDIGLQIHSRVEKVFQGALVLLTSQTVMFHKVSFQMIRKSLTPSPNVITFPPSFPGRILKKIVYLKSTYNNSVAISSLLSSDSRFTSSILNHVLLPKSNSSVAYVFFNMSNSPDADHFVPQTMQMSQEGDELLDSDRAAFQRREKALKVLESKGSSIQATLSIFSDSGNLETRIPIRGTFKPPQVTEDNLLNFGLVQIGSLVARNITIFNPSDHYVFFQLVRDGCVSVRSNAMFDSVYTQQRQQQQSVPETVDVKKPDTESFSGKSSDDGILPNSLLHAFQHSFSHMSDQVRSYEDPSLLSESKKKVVADPHHLSHLIREKCSIISFRSPNPFAYYLVGNSLETVIIPPRSSDKIGPVYFLPSGVGPTDGSVILKNNLTVYQHIFFTGRGGSGFFDLITETSKTSVNFSTISRNDLQLVTSSNQAEPYEPNLSSPGIFLHLSEKDLHDCHKKSNIKFRMTVNVINRGVFPIYVTSLSIDDLGCDAYNFQIETCKPFSLSPNQTAPINIFFSPDFSASVVKHFLVARTRFDSTSFPVEAHLPFNYLSVCSEEVFSKGNDLLLKGIVFSILALLLLLFCCLTWMEMFRVPSDPFSNLHPPPLFSPAALVSPHLSPASSSDGAHLFSADIVATSRMPQKTDQYHFSVKQTNPKRQKKARSSARELIGSTNQLLLEFHDKLASFKASNSFEVRVPRSPSPSVEEAPSSSQQLPSPCSVVEQLSELQNDQEVTMVGKQAVSSTKSTEKDPIDPVSSSSKKSVVDGGKPKKSAEQLPILSILTASSFTEANPLPSPLTSIPPIPDTEKVAVGLKHRSFVKTKENSYPPVKPADKEAQASVPLSKPVQSTSPPVESLVRVEKVVSLVGEQEKKTSLPSTIILTKKQMQSFSVSTVADDGLNNPALPPSSSRKLTTVKQLIDHNSAVSSSSHIEDSTQKPSLAAVSDWSRKSPASKTIAAAAPVTASHPPIILSSKANKEAKSRGLPLQSGKSEMQGYNNNAGSVSVIQTPPANSSKPDLTSLPSLALDSKLKTPVPSVKTAKVGKSSKGHTALQSKRTEDERKGPTLKNFRDETQKVSEESRQKPDTTDSQRPQLQSPSKDSIPPVHTRKRSLSDGSSESLLNALAFIDESSSATEQYNYNFHEPIFFNQGQTSLSQEAQQQRQYQKQLQLQLQQQQQQQQQLQQQLQLQQQQQQQHQRHSRVPVHNIHHLQQPVFFQQKQPVPTFQQQPIHSHSSRPLPQQHQGKPVTVHNDDRAEFDGNPTSQLHRQSHHQGFPPSLSHNHPFQSTPHFFSESSPLPSYAKAAGFSHPQQQRTQTMPHSPQQSLLPSFLLEDGESDLDLSPLTMGTTATAAAAAHSVSVPRSAGFAVPVSASGGAVPPPHHIGGRSISLGLGTTTATFPHSIDPLQPSTATVSAITPSARRMNGHDYQSYIQQLISTPAAAAPLSTSSFVQSAVKPSVGIGSTSACDPKTLSGSMPLSPSPPPSLATTPSVLASSPHSIPLKSFDPEPGSSSSPSSLLSGSPNSLQSYVHLWNPSPPSSTASTATFSSSSGPPSPSKPSNASVNRFENSWPANPHQRSVHQATEGDNSKATPFFSLFSFSEDDSSEQAGQQKNYSLF